MLDLTVGAVQLAIAMILILQMFWLPPDILLVLGVILAVYAAIKITTSFIEED